MISFPTQKTNDQSYTAKLNQHSHFVDNFLMITNLRKFFSKISI